jgi:hypothetical protein
MGTYSITIGHDGALDEEKGWRKETEKYHAAGRDEGISRKKG